MGNIRISVNESHFLGALGNNNFWTGHINPELTTCTTGCQDEVSLASNGAHYNTIVHTDHEVRYQGGKFCAMFRDANNYHGIDDHGCNNNQRYACEFTCQKERKYCVNIL